MTKKKITESNEEVVIKCKHCKKIIDNDNMIQYDNYYYCLECFGKCKGKNCEEEIIIIDNNNIVNGVHFNGFFYCHKCFSQKYDKNTVDRHYVQMKFQKIVGRKPTTTEWFQFQKLIDDDGWNWQKIELVLEYVYEIEMRPISEEHGIVGILPYYELKTQKFQEQLEGVYDSLKDDFEDEVITVYVRQLEKPKKEPQLTSIDDLIDWDDDDEYC